MNNWLQHLLILPIILPLLTGAVLLLFKGTDQKLKKWLSLIMMILLCVISVILFVQILNHPQQILVYALGGVSMPFAIGLVGDLLSCFFLMLFSFVFLCVSLFAYAHWYKVGGYFYSLVQFLLVGVNGCLLTGDLFNLFVFFEVMLAASYGLALYGIHQIEFKTILHYLVINLVCSSFFLIGIAIIYADIGSLNMADIAEKLSKLSHRELLLYQIALVFLGVTFLTKIGMWPFCFWLPKTYSATIAPVSAFFVVLSKVGIYVLLRVFVIMLDQAPQFLQQIVLNFIFWGGAITMIYGMLGCLAERSLARITATSVLISSGTLMMFIGYHNMDLMVGMLFYMISSILSLSALFVLAELVNRCLTHIPNMLSHSSPELLEKETDLDRKKSFHFVVFNFLFFVLVLIGIPPFAGFIAKFMSFSVLFSDLYASNLSLELDFQSWFLFLSVMLASIVCFIAYLRFGIRAFWNYRGDKIIRLHRMEILAIAMIFFGCLALTVAVQPILYYMEEIQYQFSHPAYYIENILPSAFLQNKL